MIAKGLTKAQMLKYLKSRVSLFKVPEFLFFNTVTFADSPFEVINNIITTFCGRTLVIRSSAADEDGSCITRAGEYDSVLNVSSNDPDSIRSAIGTVIASYQRNGSHSSDDEFIVQEMLLDTSMSGVVFTHDLNTGAPYYVINYDDVSGLTHTVTSGGGEYANRTLYIHRGATHAIRSKRFQSLISAIKELEEITDSQYLDVEFALDVNFIPYLLQARAITTQPKWNQTVTKGIDNALQGIQSFVKTRFKPMSGVYGNSTVLGQMPDWNPAEMIGRAPRALAFSLYKTLITDHAWCTARETMGYSVPVGQPLMVSLAGQPFIDTRLSFHSYLPNKLSSKIGKKLVDVWIKKLQQNPELHDKVEFEVAITTYSFDIDEKIKLLTEDNLNQMEISEFKDAHREQTLALLDSNHEGGIEKALENIKNLEKKQTDWNQLPNKYDISLLFEMVDNCINFGTIPFSILARHGFIAKTFLNSLLVREVLSADDIQNIQSGINTVATNLVDDMYLLQLGEISKQDFMSQYGHLRPGTYDILSSRYDQIDNFGEKKSYSRPEKSDTNFVLSDKQRDKINILLDAEGFASVDADYLLKYIHDAIVGREYGKFVFTRTVSDILEIIATFGEKHSLSRDEMSHISLDNLSDVITTSCEGSIEDHLRKIAEDEDERHTLSSAIRLPQVLFDEEGVHVVPFQVSHPNFITHKKVTAECVRLYAGQVPPSLTDKIVLIENADPGFDWIFSQQIVALITKYGGANSHMAIRCAEFGIPAAIGCGEQRFESISKSDHILLDCSAGLINTLH